MKYSKDFGFFLREQIAISTTNNGRHITFFSRLNGELFREISGFKALTDDEEREILFSIHSNLNK